MNTRLLKLLSEILGISLINIHDELRLHSDQGYRPSNQFELEVAL